MLKLKTSRPDKHAVALLLDYLAWEDGTPKGGLSAQSKKQLDWLSDNLANNNEITEKEIKTSSRQTSALEIKPGTKLIREYKGEKHEVTVLEKGGVSNTETCHE